MQRIDNGKSLVFRNCISLGSKTTHTHKKFVYQVFSVPPTNFSIKGVDEDNRSIQQENVSPELRKTSIGKVHRS